jgi:glycosyltransferase involved in cell wall biosynthesis
MNQHIKEPLVTIITVVYNGVNTLEQTIKSVINQSYQNIEYIVIDGGSTDGSLDLINKYDQHIKHWISEKDEGIYYAMNKALKIAQGSIISILNSDDWYEINTVEKVISYYQLNPKVDIIHGLLKFIAVNNKPDLITGHYSSFLDKGMIEHPTCFIKKTLYDKVGFFNVGYKSASDYEWMLRAQRSDAKFLLIPELLTNFRRGGISDSLFGASEELLIKKRFGVISNFKYFYWKAFVTLLAFKNKII